MEDQDQDLHSLLQLALTKSIESREQLSSQIAQLSMERDHLLSDQERDLISQILDKLIHEFEAPIRARLSERLSRNPAAPRALVIALANDAIEVARPILLRSTLLSDDELIRIIHHRSRQHQITIARRRELSEEVSDELVGTNDKGVITALLENQSAKISEAALSYLTEQAEHIDEFQEPLVRRQDLTQELALRLYWLVAANLRADILATYDIHPTPLDDELEAAVLDVANEKTAQSNGPRNMAETSAELARCIAADQRINAGLLIKTLRQGEIPLFEALFEEWSGISMPRRTEVLYGPGGEAMVIACLALGISKQDFATLFLLTRSAGSGGRRTSPADLSRATRLYDQANRKDAEHVLRSWQRDSDFQAAVEDMEMSRAKRG
ncbi:DUF2336 domain-containing protein [Pelagibius litoralis]|uniref:DUF2336 domain-containing protein n=1 Tax=Pelagibius litoralis TaxID=374515 RepID=A0A967EVA6_9PROT|nr:DUF2336 domain-containing protein [Pelagibius litoralis]NIA68207.1 DUF2336 domain-containing protein [Pelagibius litoralis]